MIEALLGGLAIMLMRIADVTLGTFRTLMVVQGKKYHSGIIGFFEVLIWIFAMRYIVQHMDETINLFGYAFGFGIGNILGITLDQKFAFGFVQLNIISKKYFEEITSKLRASKFATTLIPALGNNGSSSIIVTIIKRKQQKVVMNLVNSIDPDAFITVQHSRPYKGFIHGGRK
ncbi:MAG: DUF2179 domain-containing protein [Bacteroidetes bacterium]|nr:DUF2179 domain-containing protein [Bacteroidota bacterium]